LQGASGETGGRCANRGACERSGRYRKRAAAKAAVAQIGQRRKRRPLQDVGGGSGGGRCRNYSYAQGRGRIDFPTILALHVNKSGLKRGEIVVIEPQFRCEFEKVSGMGGGGSRS
jgi:hypothetical protein